MTIFSPNQIDEFLLLSIYEQKKTKNKFAINSRLNEFIIS